MDRSSNAPLAALLAPDLTVLSEVLVPPDLAAALKREPKAKRFFDGLSFSKQQWHVQSIEGAKTPETRERRIEKSVAMLREGRAR